MVAAFWGIALCSLVKVDRLSEVHISSIIRTIIVLMKYAGSITEIQSTSTRPYGEMTQKALASIF
jgi:hypothetical protein